MTDWFTSFFQKCSGSNIIAGNRCNDAIKGNRSGFGDTTPSSGSGNTASINGRNSRGAAVPSLDLSIIQKQDVSAYYKQFASPTADGRNQENASGEVIKDATIQNINN